RRLGRCTRVKVEEDSHEGALGSALMEWRLFTWRDWLTIAVVGGGLCVVFYFLAAWRFNTWTARPPGFGPEWECTRQPLPYSKTCFKKPIPPATGELKLTAPR